MLMNMYSVYDLKAEYFVPPWIARTHADAIRDFQKSVSTPNSPMGDHPSDFQLICIGTWDDISGVLTPHKEQQALGVGTDFLQTRQQDLIPLSGDPA